MNKPKGKISVGLIDDEENIRLTVGASLNFEDDIVCDQSFGTCETALHELKEGHHCLDVILLDIGLPGMNGLEGIKRLKQLSPSTKIVMMTVDERDRSILQALADGASGYIVKGASFTGQYVAHAVREVDKEGIFLDPGISKKVVEMLKSASSPARDYGLTEREKEVLGLIVEGFWLEEIGKKLNITYNTAASHYKSICSKLDVHDKGQLVRRAILDHLI